MTNAKCTVALHSLTYAMRAKEILQLNGIGTRVIRLMPGQSPNGCAFGIEVFCNVAVRASAILTGHGIENRILS